MLPGMKFVRGFLALLSVACLASGAEASAWGTGPFSNDDAADWVENEFKPRPQRAVWRAIADVLEAKGYLQVTEGANLVAACEVLAAAQGRGAKDLPADVKTLVSRVQRPTDAEREKARRALDRIMNEDSEIYGLWKDSKHFREWEARIQDLRARL
jgi:hypothetical protein